MRPPTPHTRAVIFLLLTALLWSSGGLFVKVIDWQPLSIFGGRGIIASLVFLLVLRGVRLRYSRMQLAGAAGYAAAQFLFILATKLTAAANAIFLQYTAPIHVLLLGYWILGERPLRIDWITMGAIFAGLLLFFGDALNLEGLYGNIAAVLSGISMAVMMVCMRAQKDGRPADIVLLGSLFSALIGLPSLLQESWTLPDVGIILYLGFFQTSLAFILYTRAIRQVRALESILILTLEPILNPLWVLLVVGEVPGPLAIAGGTIVIGAVVARALAGPAGPDGLNKSASTVSDPRGSHP